MYIYSIYIYIWRNKRNSHATVNSCVLICKSQTACGSRPSFSIYPNSTKCYPQCRRLLDCWVLGNILCKLQVKCENSSDWFNSAMPTKMLGLESRAAGRWKGSGKTKEKQLRKLQKQQKISRTGNSKY